MHQQEQHQQKGGKKVNGAIGLMAKKYFKQERIRRGNSGRHGEAGKDNHREQEKDNPQVGDLLHEPVFTRVIGLLAEMAGKIPPEQLKTGLPG